jgi:hypothetical protein
MQSLFAPTSPHRRISLVYHRRRTMRLRSFTFSFLVGHVRRATRGAITRAPGRAALLAAMVLFAGCFSPHFTNDQVVCKDDSACPSGYGCSQVGTCFAHGAAPRRCPAFALVCDDFEGHALMSWGDATSPPQGNGFVPPPDAADVAVDQEQPLPSSETTGFKSLRSLHVVAPGTPQTPDPTVYAIYQPYRLATPVTASAAPSTLAVRLYLYAAQPLQEQPYFLYVHDSANGGGFNVGAVGGTATQAGHFTVYDRGSNDYVIDNSAATISAAAWHCVELVTTVSNVFGTDNAVELFVDGQSVGHATLTDAAAVSARYDEVDLGNTWAQSSQPNEYYIDDVVIATQRIGCE